MSEQSYPFAHLWDQMENLFKERLPDQISVPKEEALRFFKQMYFMGMANAAMAWSSVENSISNDDETIKDLVRAGFGLGTARYLNDNRELSFEQMLNMISVHQEGAVASIVKVQRPLMSFGGDAPGALVYAEGRKHVCMVEMTDGLKAAIGEAPKAYFNATWTGKTWVIKDKVADQPW